MANAAGSLSPSRSQGLKAGETAADRRRSATPSTSNGRTPQSMHASLPQKPTVASVPQRPRHASPAAPVSASNRGRGRANVIASSSRSNQRAGDHEEKQKRVLKVLAYGEDVYSAEEDSLRQNHNQHYLNTGQRPQNFLQGTKLEDRFSEYVRAGPCSSPALIDTVRSTQIP